MPDGTDPRQLLQPGRVGIAAQPVLEESSFWNAPVNV